MADLLSPFDDDKFNKTYRFVLMTTAVVFVYIFCISFVPIPQDAKDNVKTVLIYLLGYMTAGSQYLTGGNPSPKKPDTTTPVNGDNTTVVNNPAPTADVPIQQPPATS